MRRVARGLLLLRRLSFLGAPLLVLDACAPARERSPAPTVIVPPAEDGGAARCLPLANILRTEIVDDRTILFHLRDRTVWRNRLPNRCPGLRFQGGFAYETSIDQLCDLDLIRVLPPTGGVCTLGVFEPEPLARSGHDGEE
jgi:hypothetical protein